jgi:hypothetical protein
VIIARFIFYEIGWTVISRRQPHNYAEGPPSSTAPRPQINRTNHWIMVNWLNVLSECYTFRPTLLIKQVIKMTVFWDVAPCSLVEVYRRFTSAYCLHHKSLIVLMMEAISISETSTRLHCATSQKIVIFLLAAVRTWKLTHYYYCSVRAFSCFTLANSFLFYTLLHKVKIPCVCCGLTNLWLMFWQVLQWISS